MLNHMQRKTVFTAIILFCCLIVVAQKKNASFNVHIHKTLLPVVIDGKDDDEAWKQAEPADNFFMVLPMDTSHAKVKTEVKVCYDERNFYLIAICYKQAHEVNMVESLK